MSESRFRASAIAHANIALVKYWGKADVGTNMPATGSLSITLDGLSTRTDVVFTPGRESDRLRIDGRQADPGRVTACLDLLRRRAAVDWSARIDSHNNFPMAAGLASSASAFAALVTAAAAALEMDMDVEELAELARRGSGSAARSLFGGFVELAPAGDRCVSRGLLAPGDWPLEVVIAVTSTAEKAVSSTRGMVSTASTSPYYRGWLESHPADLSAARAAVRARDFERLAEVSEASCLKMHAAALAARPGLLYWNPATVAGMHAVRALRAAGTAVFFTVDAGPQLKAICAPGDSAGVAARLAETPGVLRVLRSGLGGGARIVGETS